MIIKKIIISLTVLISGLFLQSLVHAQEISNSNHSKDIFKAKIGIKIESENELRRAKAIDKINVEDKLSVYAKSERKSYLYIINANSFETTLLNYKSNDQVITNGKGRIFPHKGGTYSPDGLARAEIFFLIISPRKNKKIIDLFSKGSITARKWQESKNIIIYKSTILAPSKLEEDIGFGGAVRGGDSFWSKIRVFAGKPLIVQRYEFDVKK